MNRPGPALGDAPPVALLHSPLLGPSSWAPVAEVLRGRGHEVVVPDLRPATTGPPFGRRYIELAGQSLARPPGGGRWVVVGHSGAGRLLAGLAAPVAALVFVDAGLPGEPTHLATAPGPVRLHAFALGGDEGVLPPWTEWWPPEALAEIVPDPVQRDLLRADTPTVPFDLLVEPLPQASLRVPSAYLSFTYDQEREAAAAAGWPVASMAGGHLHQLVDPPGVATAVVELARRAAGSQP